jgi:hypothetical protein
MTSKQIKKAFSDSVKHGTGEAYILLKNHPDIDFSNLIVGGAIGNLSQDPQCESSRADYLYQLIRNTKQRDRIVQLILERLRLQKGNRYDLDQMCDLAIKFHEAGYSEASLALNQRFQKNVQDEYVFCGQDQLIEIDGVEGILTVAKVVGEILLNDPTDSEDSFRVDGFQKENPEVDIYAELKKASKDNKYIRAYYKSILNNKWSDPSTSGRSSNRIERISYELIKEKLEASSVFFLISKRTSELTDAEVEKLAFDFLNETVLFRKERFLCFFGSRKYPLDYQTIFDIAKGPNPKGSRLVYFAIEALKHFQSDEIRKFAIKNLKSQNPGDYIRLLTSNYQSGDDVLLTEIARNAKSDDEVHSIGSEIIDLYSAVSTKECKEPLEVIYDRLNCGIHRSVLLNVLVENNVLSDKIFEEMEFDSDEDVREMFKKLKEERRNGSL